MKRLQGKSIVVCAGGTGRGASIGGVTARRVAAEGASVVVGDLDLEAAQRTAALICEAGGQAFAVEWDAVEDSATAKLFDSAVTEFGGIDGVHYNAMPMSQLREDDLDLLEASTEVWRRFFEVAVLGFVTAARCAMPYLLERGGGSIVTTSSSRAYTGGDVRVGYSATKAALGPIVRHIASRWGHSGIRANTVAPGVIATDSILARVGDEVEARWIEQSCSPRVGTPSDVAAAIAFLLSDDAQFINGQALHVDGGMTLLP